MNAALTAIAEAEGPARRHMPPPPSAHHDLGCNRTEEVPLVSKDFLMKCGVESLYIVLEGMNALERLDATTKEELADLTIAKGKASRPEPLPPMIPPMPLKARDKRRNRSFKRQIKEAIRDARDVHGDN